MHILIAAALAGASIAMPASASVYTDDLSRCLVDKTSPADRIELVQWVFAAMSASPHVEDLSRVTDAERAAHTLRAGKLISRLLTQDCRAETVKAVRYDGVQSLEQPFTLLGQVAMRDLMSDPAVAAELGGLERGVDMAALAKVMAEAGVKTPATPGATPPIAPKKP